jgi:cephalosporin hydroxylase
MNDLEDYFNKNTGRVITKWSHYFDVYDRHFSKFRGKDIVLLEIGTLHGGSLQMWKHYFGDKAKIYGIDINPNCKEVEEENVTILTGSQSDRKFLQRVKNEIPPIDILIDDGGHTMLQQIVTFEELFDHIKPEGIYLCEDMHTAYWTKFGGGLKRKGSAIEYSKNFIDQLNAYHSEQSSFKENSFTRSVNSLHYYDSILVIEKKPTPKPTNGSTGTLTIPEPEKPALKGFDLLKEKARYKIRRRLNRIASFFSLPLQNGDFI